MRKKVYVMDFNTHQLHCLVEIERTRSVSQAAANQIGRASCRERV